VSVHGGNRLGANSLLDTLIFGGRSGRHAAHRAAGMAQPQASREALESEERAVKEIVNRDRSGRRVSEIKAEMGSTMDKYAAVFRDEEGLGQGLEIIRRLQEEAKTVAIDDKGKVFNQDLFGALELGYMLDNAECVIVGAIERRESRGAQFRTDYPERNDDEWLKHINLTYSEDGPEISYSEVTITQWQPEARTY
jgi:succinate dehydrogenase / fumarate reductase flavoprotein subunit